MSKTKIRFPETTRIKDPDVREWANELMRSLDDYIQESIFIEVEAIVTAGNNIILSADPLSEKIVINVSV